MNKFVDNTNENEKLTDAIRKLGTPYVSNEPDSVYWANFRVRVMDQIAEGESRKLSSWPDRIREFIAGHVLGTSVSVATLAVLIAIAVIVKPFSGQEPQIAATSKPAISVQSALPQLAQVTEPTAPANASTPKAADIPVTHSIAKNNEAKPAEDLASLDVPENVSAVDLSEIGATDADHPASLDELSQPELESLLKSMETAE
jgi:hypothetical protein